MSRPLPKFPPSMDAEAVQKKCLAEQAYVRDRFAVAKTRRQKQALIRRLDIVRARAMRAFDEMVRGSTGIP